MPNPRVALMLSSFVLLFVTACQDSSRVQTANGGDAANARGEKPKPRPTPAPIVVPAGTALPLELRTSLSTASSRSGDLVVAVLREDVHANGRTVLPAGSELRGRVTAAVRAGKAKGQARLALTFDEAQVRGKSYPIQTSAVDISAAPQKKKDAAIIGGGVGAGALIGAAAGGKKGAGIGALLGGAAGGGTVLLTRGKDVELRAGAPLTVSLDQALRL